MLRLIANFVLLFFLSNLHTAYAGQEITITSSSGTKLNPAKLALDGLTSGNSFWESLSGYPISILWDMPSHINLSQYMISSGDSEPERMPEKWILEGSNDQKKWKLLDQRNVQPWKKNELRTFNISQNEKYVYYRMTFLSGFQEGDGIFRIFEITLDKPLRAMPTKTNPTDTTFSPDNQFQLHSDGVLEWPGKLRISKSGERNGLPSFEDGQTRAQPGGSIVIQPHGDLMRGAIDMLPTAGKTPDTGAYAEITLHRQVPSEKGFDMVSFAALARDDLPFGILLEKHGNGEPRPFIFMNFSEDIEFRTAKFNEPLRITSKGTVQIGRKRGSGSTLKLQNNDPRQVDALFIERDDPQKTGKFDSDFFKITAKSRDGKLINRYDWRLQTKVVDDGSSFVLSASRDGTSSKAKIIVRDNGVIELPTIGAGIALRSPNGTRWLLKIDNEGNIKTSRFQ
jgi:hypothetical protein